MTFFCDAEKIIVGRLKLTGKRYGGDFALRFAFQVQFDGLEFEDFRLGKELVQVRDPEETGQRPDGGGRSVLLTLIGIARDVRRGNGKQSPTAATLLP